jgi:glyoxylase I family protein
MRHERASPPFALKGIEHVLLLVNGIQPALRFYQEVLGARLESRLPQYGMAELSVGTSHIDLVDTSAAEGAWASPPVAGGRNIDHVALRLDVPDRGALRRYLADHAVEIVEERAEGEGLSLYVRDPSGNVVELMT